MLPWIRKKLNERQTAAAILPCVLLAAVCFLFLGLPVSAQTASPSDTFGVGEVERSIALSGADIRLIVANIIRAVLGLLGLLTVILMLYAGYTIMTAGGNEEKVTEGKKIMMNAVIGLAIILSAFTIVQFVIRALQGDGGGGAGGSDASSGGPLGQTTFIGSSGLGRAIKDHYPGRDQREVSRNTSIAITFAEPIRPSSFIENTNGTCWPASGTSPALLSAPDTCKKDASGAPIPYYGDCRAPAAGAVFNPSLECDRMKTGVSGPVEIGRTDTTGGRVDAAALLTYNDKGEAATAVFRPLSLLGAPGERVWYTVSTTNAILKQNGDPLFKGQFSQEYHWSFETNGSIDLSPPRVESAYPAANAAVPRNTILQLTFSEAVDPTLVQGMSGPATAFSHIIFHDRNVSGEWRVSNGYRTVEFVSSNPCGTTNSCGEEMYCLPMPPSCGSNANCIEQYTVLVRTAELANRPDQPFAGVPFSGVMDMSGNALDGNADSVRNGKPNMPDPKAIGAGEKNPDNYPWTFTVQNTIDRRAPAIEKVLPALDEEGVAPAAPISILFNAPMMGTTLSGVALEEYRKTGGGAEAPWYVPRFSIANSKTDLTLDHRPFGPGDKDYYYFVSTPSTVKSLSQNCLYPGRGPYGARGTSPVCSYSVNSFGDPVSVPGTCIGVSSDPDADTGCVRTDLPGGVAKKDIRECIADLKTASVNSDE